MHVTDWAFAPIQPSNYKHEINLYNWRYNPKEVEFTEILYGRMQVKKGDTILDLCCGDGSYSYLFLSDIAKRVDAIDYDAEAIKYAKRNYNKSNIEFIRGDVLRRQFEKNAYDVVFWTSGVAYFIKEERAQIFNKIRSTLKDDGVLYIRTPIEEKATFGANQKSVITDKGDFESELKGFVIVNEQISYFDKRTNLNYVLKKN